MVLNREGLNLYVRSKEETMKELKELSFQLVALILEECELSADVYNKSVSH